ncbi:hypothetical protein L1987_19350 [Smallanthus sonchifolius]|uniref:Uncharacterized protein n=1 Tax=Smallanthus sonchifolius TaxID=185202 RepID=A0ACB9IQW1_9ASTR|nr:hypothetical protein L1987_19350 [Smallanthus sonchifolius]
MKQSRLGNGVVMNVELTDVGVALEVVQAEDVVAGLVVVTTVVDDWEDPVATYREWLIGISQLNEWLGYTSSSSSSLSLGGGVVGGGGGGGGG